MKNRKFFLIAFICLIALTLTGCRTNKDTTSYQTPLGEVAYLADVDYKLAQDVSSITVNLSSSIDQKSVSIDTGYYKDEETKKEFVVVKTSDAQKVTTTANDYTFALKNASHTLVGLEKQEETIVDASSHQMYVLIHLGTKLDEDAGAKAKDYRKCVITISSYDFDVVEETTVASRYANTLFISEDHTTITLNQLTGLSALCAQGFGWVLYQIVHIICGDVYWVGLLIFTILVRSIGWPIYAKSNSTSQGMTKIQPEMDRINKKYEGKTDQNSKMKQQMEIKELMKKNHVSLWGCLLPFAQMPIFIVVYEMVRKFACTPKYDTLDYSFLWTDLGATQGNPKGDVVLAILVGVTMIATQLLSTYFQKRAQKKRENFYTKQNKASQKQANMTLIIMTVVMTGMMVAFAWNSAGMAFYWIIGNVYQLGQTLISKVIQAKKEEKEELASGKVRGRN